MCNSLLSVLFAVVLATTAAVNPAIAQTPPATTAKEKCVEAKKLAAQEAAKKETDRIAARLKVQEAQIDGDITAATSEAAKKGLEAKKLAAQEAAKKQTDAIAAKLKVTEAQIDASSDCDPAGSAPTARPANPCDGEPLFCSFLKGEADLAGLDAAAMHKLIGLLRSPRPGTSKEAVMKFDGPRQARTVAAVFADPRLKEVVSAGVSGGITAYFAANPVPAAVDLGPLTRRVETAERFTEAAHGRLDLADRKIGGAVEGITALGTAVLSVRGARPVLGGGGLRKEDRLSLEEKLACARHLALTGQVKDGCTEPVR